MLTRIARRISAPATPVPDTDPALDDLDLRSALHESRHGNWRPVANLVAATGADWERRWHRIDALSQAAVGGTPWLDNWLAELPDDHDVLVLHAATLRQRAAKARGAAPASMTSQARFQRFADLSAQARDVGHRAIEAAPDDPTPIAVVMRSLFSGGGASRRYFADLYAEGRRRDPHLHPPGRRRSPAGTGWPSPTPSPVAARTPAPRSPGRESTPPRTCGSTSTAASGAATGPPGDGRTGRSE